MKVQLLTHSTQPEKIIACAAKLCYSPIGIDELYDGLTEEKSIDFVDMLATLGHESPIEHVTFTFGIEGVSRALLAQITRHRMASFSVQSQRYVKENQFEFVMPPEIEEIPLAKQLFLQAMEQDLDNYNTLADILKEKHKQTFLSEGLSEKAALSKAEKKAIEDARFVLPNACDTKMIVTMNARSLMNFFKHRCCNRAQWEIKAVADEMLKLVYEIAPTLFQKGGPGCVRGGCSEGKMTCGKVAEVREFYANIKQNGGQVDAQKDS